jgi:hypothetical protein
MVLIGVDMPPEEDAELRPPASEAGTELYSPGDARPSDAKAPVRPLLANTSGFV